ncbi:MAG: PilZ domain-containing protein [Phycisphaerae bacterium]
MSKPIELSGSRQEELLREAVSRQMPLCLSYRPRDGGWMNVDSMFLGFDRSSGDLVVAAPAGPEHLAPEFVEGQSVGVAFRRAHRKCVFETSVTGRCFFAEDRGDDVPAIRLLWPTSVFELQRRLYYRTPLPPGMELPVEVWRWGADPEDSGFGQPLRGTMVDISAGGVSLALREQENPHWCNDTPVGCAFTAGLGGERIELYGHTRYLRPARDGQFRLGIQFLGLETDGDSRGLLEQVLKLTGEFQNVEMNRLAKA